MARLPLLLSFVAAAGIISGCELGSKPERSLEVAAVGVYNGDFNTDGSYAIVGSIYHGGSLWRITDGERLYNWNHTEDESATIIAADFDLKDKWAVTADPHNLVLWKMEDGSAHRFWTAPAEILDIKLAHDASFALLGTDNNSALIFDIQRGGIKRTFSHTERVRSVDLSEDGSVALTGSDDQSAISWDIKSARANARIKHDAEVQMVALSPNGKLAFSASKYDKAIVWHAETGKVVGSLDIGAENLRRGMRFTAAKFSQDGKHILTGRPDQVVQLWSTQNFKELKRWKLPKRNAWKPTSAAVVAVAFGNREGRYFAMASNGFVHQLEFGK